jgi:hypothetical protein
MTMHMNYDDVTTLLSLWHFIKHSACMLLVMASPSLRAMAPPHHHHPRAMAAVAPVSPRAT